MKRQLKRLMLTLMLGAPLSAYADVSFLSPSPASPLETTTH
jgi:hypothetical protein